MGKRGRVLIAVAAIAVLAVLAWAVLHVSTPEPVYQGKPLSYWLLGYGFPSGHLNGPSRDEADAAIRDAGTNAIPLLLEMMRARDSSTKIKLAEWGHRLHLYRGQLQNTDELRWEALTGFSVLGSNAVSAVPGLVKILDENSDSNAIVLSEIILGNLHRKASNAVPALLRRATGPNKDPQGWSLIALGQIGCDPDEVVPVMIMALHDPSPKIRARAAGSFWEFGDKAKPAMPALIQIMSEPDGGSNSVPIWIGAPTDPSQFASVRDIAKGALRQMDPKVYSQIITNTARFLRR
jgi:hypothetical protein